MFLPTLLSSIYCSLFFYRIFLCFCYSYEFLTVNFIHSADLLIAPDGFPLSFYVVFNHPFVPGSRTTLNFVSFFPFILFSRWSVSFQTKLQ